MGFFSASNAAKYRAEGLSLMQASRLEACRAKDDFKRTLAIAGLVFMLVGTLSFIAVQASTRTVEVATAAPQTPPKITAQAAPQPAPEPALQIAQLPPADMAAPQPEPAPAAAVPVRPVSRLVSQDLPAAPTVGAATVSRVAMAPTQASCVATLARLAEQSTIYFRIGSAQLGESDLVRLTAIARAASDCPDAQIQVTGHSDTTGSDFVNFDLSWKRADNAVQAIAAQGFDISHFEAVGFGARAPASQGSASDEDVNRRVEFVVLRRAPQL